MSCIQVCKILIGSKKGKKKQKREKKLKKKKKKEEANNKQTKLEEGLSIEEGEIVTLSEQNGAVSATNTDRESEIPNPEIMTLPEENSVVTITNVDRPDELSQPKSVGAVTATVEEGEFVPPPSPTPATKQCVPVENDGIVSEHTTSSFSPR